MMLRFTTLGGFVAALATLTGCIPTPTEVATDSAVSGSGTSNGDGTGTTGGLPPGDTGTSDDGGSSSDDTGPPIGPMCGDGIVEGDEECDLGSANGTGEYCRDDCQANVCGDGYEGPGEACDDGNQDDTDDCTNACGPASCGDGVVQPGEGEECDLGRMNSQTGDCLPSCQNPSCGDGFIQMGVETCDGTEIGAETCMSQGFDDGTLLCANDCMAYDTSNCFECGNGVAEPNEECDGPDLDGLTCDDFTPGGKTPSGGSLSCNGNCTFNTDACTYCGDDVAEGTEDCDGSDLSGGTCENQGFDGGTLSCSACSYDTSSCTECGNGVVEAGEDCDDGNLDGATCVSEGFDGGSLGCNNGSCTYDTNNCYECGDDEINPGETCDGTDLDMQTCESVDPVLYGGGNLGCLGDCSDFDESGCCVANGQSCAIDDDCCSMNCNMGMGVCNG